MHSNGDALMSGTQNVVVGKVYYVGNFVVTGTTNVADGVKGQPEPFPSLPHSLDWYRERALEEGTLFTGSVEVQGEEEIRGLIYVEGGDIYLATSYLSGEVTLISSDGKVIFKGSHFLNLGPYVDGLLAYGAEGIYIEGSDNRLRGMIYSPKAIEWEQSGTSFRGVLVGGSVSISGNGGNFAPSIGGVGVGEKCVLLE